MHECREYFDLSEANALIPTLEYYFAELARIQREVNELTLRAQKLGVTLDVTDATGVASNALKEKLQQQCTMLASEYADIIDEVHELGVVIEDPDLGTVNFYSWVDGDEVVLSWQYGEPEVSHWFKVTEDFMARRPLDPRPSSSECLPSLH
jgi:hypothetical protein